MGDIGYLIFMRKAGGIPAFSVLSGQSLESTNGYFFIPAIFRFVAKYVLLTVHFAYLIFRLRAEIRIFFVS